MKILLIAQCIINAILVVAFPIVAIKETGSWWYCIFYLIFVPMLFIEIFYTIKSISKK